MNAVKPIDDPAKWNKLLETGFPIDQSVLSRMPFGKSMLEAYNKKDPTTKKPLHKIHLRQIVKVMNTLLDGGLSNVIADPKADKAVNAQWTLLFEKINGGSLDISDDEKLMWRLEAFLHDVGKALTYSKHPTRGFYLVTRLVTHERDRLKNILGDPKFDQLEKVIAFHDRFGVVTTGEASYGILADMVDRGVKHSVEDAARKIGHVWVLNIIDAAAALGGLPRGKMKTYLDVFEKTCWNEEAPLMRSQGDRDTFERELLKLASAAGSTIERITRLLTESYREGRKIAEKKGEIKGWVDVHKIDFNKAASVALQAHSGFRFADFRVDLAHVVKLDYLLCLTGKVVYEHWTRDKNPDRLAVCIVGVVKKLTEQFVDLIRRGKERSRIGIDLSVLRETEEVQDEIARLLSGNFADATFALEWLAEETGAWPF